MGQSKEVREGKGEGNTLQADSRDYDANKERDRKHLSSDPNLSLISFNYHVCGRLLTHTYINSAQSCTDIPYAHIGHMQSMSCFVRKKILHTTSIYHLL